MTYNFAFDSDIIFATASSKWPFPLKPKFIHSIPNDREIIFVYAIPGLEAQPPWVILVP